MEIWKRFHEKEVTHSMAHYLQAIAALSHGAGATSVSAVADRLGVSKAGVTSMLRTLKGRGLVEHEPYGDVKLTPEGGRLAARTELGREVLTRFFEETLSVPSATAREDACMIEHLVSPPAMMELLRLTGFLHSDHPAAVAFREAFREYRGSCASTDEIEACPLCQGRCLRETFEDVAGGGPGSEEDAPAAGAAGAPGTAGAPEEEKA